MIKRQILLLALILFVFTVIICSTVSAANVTWVNETADSEGDVGWSNSLALDSSGNPHISYYDGTNLDLKYAFKSNGTWHNETVDSEGDVGWHTSLALDSSGNPHISYYDKTNGDLKYAFKSNGTWTIETVDSTGDVGLESSLALDSNDNPHISYYNYDLWDLKYAVKSNGTWAIETVDTEGGSYSSLALDSSGNPHISYIDNEALMYAVKSNGTWTKEALTGSWRVEYSTSLALDSSDNPHISYYDMSNRDLRYISKSSGTWTTETVDSTGNAGWDSFLALDSSGKPYISYIDGTTYDLKYAVKSSGTWTTETLDHASMIGSPTSIVLDSLDFPHISYYNLDNRDLKYIYIIDNITPTVYANSTGGLFNTSQSVLLTANDNLDPNPVIHYTTDGINWNQFTGSGTVPITNEGTTNLEFYAIDAAGNPSAHTTYSYTIDKTAPMIAANPTNGLSNTTIDINLSSEPDATIYYRVNGGSWDTFIGSGIVSISDEGNDSLEFYAVDAAGNPSAHTTYSYTIDKTAPVVTADPTNGLSNGSINVTLSSEPDATIYYTTDGINWSHFTGSGTVSITNEGTTSLEFYAVDAAGNPSNHTTYNYTIDKIAPTAWANPKGGSYDTDQSITLSMSETGTIYYTTDGTTPTTASTEYTGPITISSKTILKFIAVDSAGNQSSVYTEKYSIKHPK